jgi:chromosome segregation ATPase
LENLKSAYKELENKLRKDAELYGDRIVELQSRIEDLQEQITSIRVVHDIEEHMNPAKKQLTTIIQKPAEQDSEQYNKLMGKYNSLVETNAQNKDLSEKEFNLRVELEKQIRVMRDQIETERMLRSGLEQELGNLRDKLKVADTTVKDLEQAIDQLKQGSGEVVFESM